MIKPVHYLIILLLWSWLLPALSAQAAGVQGNGLQLAVAGSYQTKMPGEFNGQSLPTGEPMVTNKLIVDVPELTPDNYGITGRLGYKANRWAWEFQYNQSAVGKIATSLPLSASDLTMAFYDLNAKYYVFQPSSFQSYLIFGFGYATLSGTEMKQSEDLAYGPGQYEGWGYNLGIGLSYYLNTTVFIFGDYMYRGLSYTMFDHSQLHEALSQPLHVIYLGLGYALSH